MKKLLFMIAFTAFILSGCIEQQKGKTDIATSRMIQLDVPARAEGQKSVLGLTVAPIENVRVGFIGLGNRGIGAVDRFSFIKGATIMALCDIRSERVEATKNHMKKLGLSEVPAYSGTAEAWKELCDRDDIDLVYICTDWANHVPMALYAMSKGKHVAVEVPAASTIADCWKLIDMAEQKQLHCMMLENCVYDFFEMATLNMAQQGIFGEIVHTEGAYIHDLRTLNFDTTQGQKGGYYDMWRLKHNKEHDGNPYPTHGLGPISQIMNIHRGDKMNYLVSMSSGQYGMTAYAKENFGDSSEYNTNYAKGDINVTMIKTANGKSIMIQHDVTSPRPYSRLHTISGTKGFAQKYPIQQIAIEPNAHSRLPEDKMNDMLAQYEHPIVKEVGDMARKVGGHGGMDFIMDYRLIYCLNNGLPLDMDVYDAAEWSCLTELTEMSVKNNSMPVEVPDFTRGDWNKVKGYRHATK